MRRPDGIGQELEALLGRNAEINAALLSAGLGIGALLIFVFTPVTDSASDATFRAQGCVGVAQKVACIARPNIATFCLVVLPFFAIPVTASLLHQRRHSRRARVVLYVWSLLWGLFVGLTSLVGIGLIYVPSAAMALVASIIAGRPGKAGGGGTGSAR